MDILTNSASGFKPFDVLSQLFSFDYMLGLARE